MRRMHPPPLKDFHPLYSQGSAQASLPPRSPREQHSRVGVGWGRGILYAKWESRDRRGDVHPHLLA